MVVEDIRDLLILLMTHHIDVLEVMTGVVLHVIINIVVMYLTVIHVLEIIIVEHVNLDTMHLVEHVKLIALVVILSGYQLDAQVLVDKD